MCVGIYLCTGRKYNTKVGFKISWECPQQCELPLHIFHSLLNHRLRLPPTHAIGFCQQDSGSTQSLGGALSVTYKDATGLIGANTHILCRVSLHHKCLRVDTGNRINTSNDFTGGEVIFTFRPTGCSFLHLWAAKKYSKVKKPHKNTGMKYLFYCFVA
jgi:hypothetical protein